MRICDRCQDISTNTHEVVVIEEDQYFDLCDKHMQELMEFLTTKEKPKRGLFKKDSAKAA